MADSANPKEQTIKLSEKVAQRIEYRAKHISDFMSLLRPELEKDDAECDVLDVGCGLGVYSLAISPHVKSVYGIDYDSKLVACCKKSAGELGLHNVKFERISALDLKDREAYDIVILSDVLEHIKEQSALLNICINALRPGGVMYISTNNKWWPIEGHKFLPFLTYMPRNIANKYVRFMGKGNDYEGYYLPSYMALREMLDKLPAEYVFKPPINRERLMYRVGARLVEFSQSFWLFANAFQVIVKKN